MVVPYNDYPTEETRLIAHMLDFSLHQASSDLLLQHMVAVASQLSAAAAYAGVLSVLLRGTSLGATNAVVMRDLADQAVVCVEQVMYVTTPN